MKAPKLTIVNGWQCIAGTGQRMVESSKGGKYYTVHLSADERTPHTCDCPHFRFRDLGTHFETCKHIDEALKDACGWNSVIHGGEPVRCRSKHPHADMKDALPCPACDNAGVVCPRCEGPLMRVSVGV